MSVAGRLGREVRNCAGKRTLMRHWVPNEDSGHKGHCRHLSLIRISSAASAAAICHNWTRRRSRV